MTAFLPPFLGHHDDTSIETWVERLVRRGNEHDSSSSATVVLTVRTHPNNALAGLLILNRADDDENIIHLGYLLAKTAWGQGLATELVQGLVAHLQQQDSFRGQVRGGVDRHNPASARVLQKADFVALSTPADDGPPSAENAVEWFERDIVGAGTRRETSD